MTRWRASYARILSSTNSRVNFILDIEDSTSDSFCSQLNSEIKHLARLGLHKLLNRLILSSSREATIRINSLGKEFIKDLETLAPFSKSPIRFTFLLPKIRHSEEVIEYHKLLSQTLKGNITLHPIIETKEAMQNISSICEVCDKLNKKKEPLRVFYGYFDYLLDISEWPFPHINETKFWELAKPVIDECKKHGYSFAQPPFISLQPAEISKHLDIVFHQLKSLRFALDSLSSVQTKTILNHHRLESSSIALNNAQHSESALLEYTDKIIKEFESTRAHRRSFSATKDQFIPPHFYLGAKKWLNQRQLHSANSP